MTADTRAIGLIIGLFAMPFVAAFHTSLGGPWMLTSTLTIVVFVLISAWSLSAIVEAMPEEDSPSEPKPDASPEHPQMSGKTPVETPGPAGN